MKVRLRQELEVAPHLTEPAFESLIIALDTEDMRPAVRADMLDSVGIVLGLDPTLSFKARKWLLERKFQERGSEEERQAINRVVTTVECAITKILKRGYISRYATIPSSIVKKEVPHRINETLDPILTVSRDVSSEVALGELFDNRKVKDLGREIRTVLISGGPGTGKTTLSTKIAYLWATNHWYPDKFEAVYILPVKRLANVFVEETWNPSSRSKGEHLERTIARECFMFGTEMLGLEDAAFQLLTEYITEQLEERPERVLLILDGLSEEQNFAGDIGVLLGRLKARLKAYRTKTYQLLLSRPTSLDGATFNLREQQKFLEDDVTSLVLETAGFGDVQIAEYTKRFFQSSNPEEGEALLALLRRNPKGFSLARAPMNLGILCNLWSEAAKADKSKEGILRASSGDYQLRRGDGDAGTTLLAIFRTLVSFWRNDGVGVLRMLNRMRSSLPDKSFVQYLYSLLSYPFRSAYDMEFRKVDPALQSVVPCLEATAFQTLLHAIKDLDEGVSLFAQYTFLQIVHAQPRYAKSAWDVIIELAGSSGDGEDDLRTRDLVDDLSPKALPNERNLGNLLHMLESQRRDLNRPDNYIPYSLCRKCLKRMVKIAPNLAPPALEAILQLYQGDGELANIADDIIDAASPSFTFGLHEVLLRAYHSGRIQEQELISPIHTLLEKEPNCANDHTKDFLTRAFSRTNLTQKDREKLEESLGKLALGAPQHADLVFSILVETGSAALCDVALAAPRYAERTFYALIGPVKQRMHSKHEMERRWCAEQLGRLATATPDYADEIFSLLLRLMEEKHHFFHVQTAAIRAFGNLMVAAYPCRDKAFELLLEICVKAEQAPEAKAQGLGEISKATACVECFMDLVEAAPSYADEIFILLTWIYGSNFHMSTKCVALRSLSKLGVTLPRYRERVLEFLIQCNDHRTRPFAWRGQIEEVLERYKEQIGVTS